MQCTGFPVKQITALIHKNVFDAFCSPCRSAKRASFPTAEVRVGSNTMTTNALSLQNTSLLSVQVKCRHQLGILNLVTRSQVIQYNDPKIYNKLDNTNFQHVELLFSINLHFISDSFLAR